MGFNFDDPIQVKFQLGGREMEAYVKLRPARVINESKDGDDWELQRINLCIDEETGEHIRITQTIEAATILALRKQFLVQEEKTGERNRLFKPRKK